MSFSAIFISGCSFLAFVAGILMFAARTGPDEAVSNLSKWLEKAGAHRIPSWLRDQAADRWVLRYGRYIVVFLLILGGAFFYNWWSSSLLPKESNLLDNPTTIREARPVSSIEVPSRTKADINRLLDELPDIYNFVIVAKTSLLPDVQDIINNGQLNRGYTIDKEINEVMTLVQKISYFQINIDNTVKDKFNTKELSELISGADILHELNFHLSEYARIMQPQFVRRPENFDQAKWLLGNGQYLHERDLLSKQAETFQKWIDESVNRIMKKREQLNLALQNAK